MTLKQNLVKFYAIVAVATVLGITSCKEEEAERLTLQDSADITEEAITDSYFQDLDDMAGIAIEAPTDTEYSSGRTTGSITIEDHRFCDGVVISIVSDAESTPDVPIGVLTIDFGTSGCEDLKHNVRKGKLIFTYHGKRFMPESTVVTTTENYSINGVKLEGTRTLTNGQTSTLEAPRFNVVLASGKATFPDGVSATRESNITWQWNRAANPIDDNLEIEMTSTASGTTRTGREYVVTLLDDLVYKRYCGIAVSGIKKYVIDGGKEITIDYGDGTCDRSLTITVNGVVHEITV